MLHEKEKKGIIDILKLMPEEEVRMLAQTVTSNMIITTTVEEAMDAIMLHSPTAESVLLRKRVSREILFKYLHNNSVPTITTDKGTMVRKILHMWECVPHEESASVIPKTPQLGLEAHEIDEMAQQFTVWFYSLLNQCQLGMEHFWPDCSMCLVSSSEKYCSKLEITNSAADVVQLIWDTKAHNNLHFNPNVSHEGVQGRTDLHGLVMVLACGTLHQQDRCVGIFEQLFGLIRDPSACNNWKIKYTNLNLKGTSNITTLPTLAEGSLLSSVTSVSSPSQSA